MAPFLNSWMKIELKKKRKFQPKKNSFSSGNFGLAKARFNTVLDYQVKKPYIKGMADLKHLAKIQYHILWHSFQNFVGIAKIKY